MRRLVILAFLSLLPAAALAQKPEVKPSTDTSAKPRDYSQEAYVVEQLSTRYRFENDGTGRKEVTARIKVQSEAGVEQWGQLVMGYNSANERVEIPYVRVLQANGRVVTAAPDAVQDLSAPVEREAPVYTDYRQKHITVPGLRPGDVLEYDLVTVTHTALAPGQFWMQYDFDKGDIVLQEQLEIDIPQGRAVKLKTKPGVDPVVTEKDGRRTYRWTASHLEREDEDKDKKDKKKKPPTEPEPPAIQLTTFDSWEQMGRWYAGLEKDRLQPTPEIKAKAAELTAGKTSDIDKIEALYDYVATNFRYISLSFGVGRYQPHAAADVLHNQYGDCKDKHTLLAALLEAQGFHPSSVLINSSRKLDPDVPSPSQFDHMITLVPLGKEEIWMDTTTEVAPFRLLSFNIRKKQALVIPDEGTTHLEETPADPPMRDSQAEDIDGTVNAIGKLQAHVKFEVRGDAELFLRLLFRRVPNSKWNQLVKQLNTMGGLDGEVTNLNVGDPADTHEPFQFEYDISAENFLDWTKKKSELTMPLSQLGLAAADEDNTGPDAEPIRLGAPTEHVYRIKLTFPAGYTPTAPLPFSMKRDYATYDASYRTAGTEFIAERKLVTAVSELPATRTSDYLAFRRAVMADAAQTLLVDHLIAGKPAIPSDLKSDDLNSAGRAALDRGDVDTAIDLLKRAVELDPKNKWAWNSLGDAYLAERKTDDAVAAFKKQIELNAYDEYAYNNLGRAYWLDRKYEDAAAAFQKQLEVNPLDKFAHANLGQMYAEWHKYDLAAPELEKAAAIRPDDAFLQISLGDTYLNLGQDDKALAAFDRAVEISATPEVWNDIAYQLSLKKVHLDRALQYAESAVTAVATALRNVSLDQLSQRDLALVGSLFANWDTLGWVYFAQGDLKQAEKYVSAAWVLGQYGEVGDHLGQIYEKMGRKDDAVRAYAMALSGLRPVPETRGRLAALLGGDDKVAAATEKYKPADQALRTIPLGKVAKQTGSAEFFVLLSGGNSGAHVENVKFINGDEGLKVFAEALRTAKYNVAFPDDTPTKIVRRGVLGCSKTTGDCTFVLLLPEDVRSVN
jgi:tetratricopeptide (TPR) repeat protein/transglutaminase-like putative cysteine protease